MASVEAAARGRPRAKRGFLRALVCARGIGAARQDDMEHDWSPAKLPEKAAAQGSPASAQGAGMGGGCKGWKATPSDSPDSACREAPPMLGGKDLLMAEPDPSGELSPFSSSEHVKIEGTPTADSTPFSSAEIDIFTGAGVPSRPEGGKIAFSHSVMETYGLRIGDPSMPLPAAVQVEQCPSPQDARERGSPAAGTPLAALAGRGGSPSDAGVSEGTPPGWARAEESQDTASMSHDASMASRPAPGAPLAGASSGAVTPALAESLVRALGSDSPEERHHAAVQVRKLTKADNGARLSLAKAGAVERLMEMVREQHPTLVEAGVYALLVVAMNEEVKWSLNSEEVLRTLLDLVSHPQFSIQEGAVAMVYSLSSLDRNKVLTAAMGGIPVLLDVMMSGSARMKRDVLRTLYNLSLLSDNKAALLQARVVHPLVRLISLAPAHKLSDIAISIMRNLATRDEGRDALVAYKAVPVLARVLECGSPAGKEEAVAILSVLSSRNPAHRALIATFNVIPVLRGLAATGTARTRTRAEELLQELKQHTKHGK